MLGEGRSGVSAGAQDRVYRRPCLAGQQALLDQPHRSGSRAGFGPPVNSPERLQESARGE